MSTLTRRIGNHHLHMSAPAGSARRLEADYETRESYAAPAGGERISAARLPAGLGFWFPWADYGRVCPSVHAGVRMM